jgi:hypothetical protein
MTVHWKVFLAVRFPVALLAILTFVQLIALSLVSVPLRRFDTDSFPEAISNDAMTHRVLLFGDSITGNATRRYNVGPQNEVLNLTSHGYIGLPGSLLMLKRYLNSHSAPEYVSFVTSPEFFVLPQDPERLHYYSWNIFKNPEEHTFLKRLYSTVDSSEWLPAALNLQQTIAEPFLSLLQRGPAKFRPLGADPDPAVSVEPASANGATEEAIRERIEEPTDLIQPAAVAMEDLCQLSSQLGFKVDIVWAPAPAPVFAHWREVGAMTKLENQIRNAMGPECVSTRFSDFNDTTTYLSFDRAALHLRGDGWEQLFASQVNAHLKGLPRKTARFDGPHVGTREIN